jgi:hypothetical protein
MHPVIAQARPWGALLLLWTLSLPSCQSREPEEYRTSSDLVRTLQDAGVEWVETEKAARPEFEAPGRVFQVSGGELEVFEYRSSAARRDVSDTISSDGSSVLGHDIGWSVPIQLWAVDRLIVVYGGTDGGMILTLMGLLGDPLTGLPLGPEEPFPPAIVEAMRWLAAQQAARPEEVEVVQYESAEWSDSCLGLGRADEACLAVITPGYRVTIRLRSVDYVVRTNELGDQIRMED